MNQDAGSTTNIGDALRDGTVLTATEAVAVIHEACRQVQDGRASTIPGSASEISLDDDGLVHNHAAGPTRQAGPAVAALLEALLPPSSTAADAVPPALRTLPSRLRDSASPKAAGLKDLLVILKWHLPADPRQVLQQLAQRLGGNAPATAARKDDAFVEQFDEAPPVVPIVRVAPSTEAAVLPAAPTPTIAPVPRESRVAAVTPINAVKAPAPPPSVEDLPLHEPLRAAAPAAAARPRRTTPVAAMPTTAPASRSHRTNRGLLALVAVLLLALSGLVGYRLTNARSTSAPADTPAEAPRSSPPRVVPAPGSAGGATSGSSGSQSRSAAPSGAASAARDQTPPSREQAPPPTPRVSLTEPRVQALPLNVAGGAFSPSFSRDGEALYFHSGRDNGRLMEAVLTDPNPSSTLKPVVNDQARNFHGRPSPDGRWIAFDSDREGTRGVYIVGNDGRNLQRVSGAGFAAVPSWSPDMKWLAFVRGEPSRPRVWNLWLREMASGELKRISGFRSGQVWSASWFPDGRAICYSHEDHLIVTNLADGTSRTFKSPVAGRLTRTPAVSPDGSRIVFQVFGDGVWMLDVNSGDMRRVLDDRTAEEFAWDPQGRRVAYHSRRDGQWRIWVMTL